ncbi:unnamed protein product, partial [Discosporangium mesarthrocarpum]
LECLKLTGGHVTMGKKKDSDGGKGGGNRSRGVRKKNIFGSESKGLFQAAAASGFVGFAVFAAPARRAGSDSPSRGKGKTSGSGSKWNTGASRGSGQGRRAAVFPGKGGRALPLHYQGSDDHLAVVAKRLSTRDSTTKLKALAELQAICRAVWLRSGRGTIPMLLESAHLGHGPVCG